MNKLYKYCPYCGEQLENHMLVQRQKTSIDDIDPKELDERNIVLIDLNNESMRVPFSLKPNSYLITELDKKRLDLINTLKKTKEEK